MEIRKDLTNQRFGHLTVLGPYRKVPYGNTGRIKTEWECRCQCGNTVWRQTDALVQGQSDSCGCMRMKRVLAKIGRAHKAAGKANYKHGTGLENRLYRIWTRMKGRCQNPNERTFHYYGGRGITVCPEWQEFVPFRDWALINGYSASLTIDRINNDGNYEPSNCRWISQKEQICNRRTTIMLSPTLALSSFCESHKVSYDLVWHTFVLYKTMPDVFNELLNLLDQQIT